MLKNALAIIVIGSFIAGSSFANPLNIKNIFMKDHMMKSSMVSKNHTKNTQSRFSGTWAGTCTRNGESDEVKIEIEENDFDFSIIDNGRKETASYDVLESKTSTDGPFDHYNSSTGRLSKVNENTVKFEGNEIFARLSDKEKSLQSMSYTVTFIVNNNQLTIDSVMRISNGDKNESVDKCILKRAG